MVPLAREASQHLPSPKSSNTLSISLANRSSILNGPADHIGSRRASVDGCSREEISVFFSGIRFPPGSRKYRRNTVASRIRFEAFACAGFPASATVLRRHLITKQRVCRRSHEDDARGL